jgi:hypothetical protein
MEFVSLSITTHVYSIMALMIIMIFNYLSVSKMDQFIPLAKRLRFMTPLFHMANAFVVYTGAIVAAYSHDLSITVILMIATSIFVMVTEIKRYKKMRVIKSGDYELQKEFVLFAKKIYTMQIIAVMFTYVISKLF